MSAQDARTPPAPRPAARRWFARGRSPGSHVLPHRLPGLTQWRLDAAAHAYRCGGSSGFALSGAPLSRFTAAGIPARSTSREVRRPWGRRGADYSSGRRGVIFDNSH